MLGSNHSDIEIFDFDGNLSTHGGIYPIAEICRRWGGVGVRGVSRMDAAAKPYLMEIWQRRRREPAWAAVQALIATIAM